MKLALLASAWLVWPGLAFGQNVDRGDDVTVNPVAPGGATLLYPGGDYMRTVRPLLQPGETVKDTGVIHLHMPTKNRLAERKREASADETASPEPVKKARMEPKRETKPEPKRPPPAREAKAEPVPKAQPKPVKQAKAEAGPIATAPPNKPAYNPGFGGYTDQGAAGLNFGAPAPAQPIAPPAPQPKQMAKANPPPASAAPAPAAEAATPGLTKRSVILFAPDAADPAQSALGAIKFLAGDLSAAMTSASARVQIQAYGGNRGDKSSDARRLSLKRALAIRQVLIDDGVPAERIDVRAMGGADDSGPADRVDVYVKA
ncbi:MAG TPA: OmpA family protein [Rhizomicrobium sp.]|nr:OmpA family protein [Rhizomicrobium sp.]